MTISSSKTNFRTPLAQVRSLGSARHGAKTWLAMRIGSLALIPLCLWFVAALIWCITLDDAVIVAEWVQRPLTLLLLPLLLVTMALHAAHGLAEVLTDYIHHEGRKLVAIVIVKGTVVLLTLAGLIAIAALALKG